MGAAQPPVNQPGSIASLMAGYGGGGGSDFLGNLAAGLIQASGPSATPRSFVDILASGIGSGVQGQAGSEDKALKRALVASQVATADQKLKQQAAWEKILSGPQAPAAAAPPDATNPGSPAPFQAAIGGMESGNKYDAVGPQNPDGDHAYGRYQVKGTNIGPWTQEVLGKPLTPQEFLADPKAQDAVFNTKFGQYHQKYGPEGAARAWFA